MNLIDVEQCVLDAKREALQMKKSPEKIEEIINTITELGMAMTEERSIAEIEQERITSQHKKELERDKKILNPLMENAKKHIDSSTGIGGYIYKEKDTANLSKDLLPAFVDNLAIKHLVGVQPMVGPVGIIYVLEMTDNNGNTYDDEINDRKLVLEVTSRAVEAGSRKLPFDMSTEMIEDMRSGSSSFNIVNEITKNIYEETKEDIVKIAHKDRVNVTDDYTVGKLKAIIGQFSNEIARKSRRGAGNWLIVSETVAKILKPELKYDLALTNRTY